MSFYEEAVVFALDSIPRGLEVRVPTIHAHQKNSVANHSFQFKGQFNDYSYTKAAIGVTLPIWSATLPALRYRGVIQVTAAKMQILARKIRNDDIQVLVRTKSNIEGLYNAANDIASDYMILETSPMSEAEIIHNCVPALRALDVDYTDPVDLSVAAYLTEAAFRIYHFPHSYSPTKQYFKKRDPLARAMQLAWAFRPQADEEMRRRWKKQTEYLQKRSQLIWLRYNRLRKAAMKKYYQQIQVDNENVNIDVASPEAEEFDSIY